GMLPPKPAPVTRGIASLPPLTVRKAELPSPRLAHGVIGNTPDSGSGIWGSSPCGPTKLSSPPAPDRRLFFAPKPTPDSPDSPRAESVKQRQTAASHRGHRDHGDFALSMPSLRSPRPLREPQLAVRPQSRSA